MTLRGTEVWRNEKLAKPKISAEFMTFWLYRFRKLDVRQKFHRKMLIDTFINAIFLYDDKMVITFNYKEGTDTITFDDLKASPAAEKSGSDLDCLTAPNEAGSPFELFYRKAVPPHSVSIEMSGFSGNAQLRFHLEKADNRYGKFIL